MAYRPTHNYQSSAWYIGTLLALSKAISIFYSIHVSLRKSSVIATAEHSWSEDKDCRFDSINQHATLGLQNLPATL